MARRRQRELASSDVQSARSVPVLKQFSASVRHLRRLAKVEGECVIAGNLRLEGDSVNLPIRVTPGEFAATTSELAKQMEEVTHLSFEVARTGRACCSELGVQSPEVEERSAAYEELGKSLVEAVKQFPVPWHPAAIRTVLRLLDERLSTSDPLVRVSVLTVWEI